MRKLKVIIPCFCDEVAPLFEAAQFFGLWTFTKAQVSDYREITLSDKDPFSRIRMLLEEKVEVLICNGIQSGYKRLLENANCKVINGITGVATHALFGFMSGKISADFPNEVFAENANSTVTADLIAWTRDFFIELGWEIDDTLEQSSYPVELIGRKNCPICGKPVIIAISCGACVYRVDKEIREFQRITSGNYDCRVYVHQAMEGVEKACKEYNIELIDPSVFKYPKELIMQISDIPPLKNAITHHEKLNLTSFKRQT